MKSKSSLLSIQTALSAFPSSNGKQIRIWGVEIGPIQSLRVLNAEYESVDSGRVAYFWCDSWIAQHLDPLNFLTLPCLP